MARFYSNHFSPMIDLILDHMYVGVLELFPKEVLQKVQVN